MYNSDYLPKGPSESARVRSFAEQQLAHLQNSADSLDKSSFMKHLQSITNEIIGVPKKQSRVKTYATVTYDATSVPQVKSLEATRPVYITADMKMSSIQSLDKLRSMREHIQKYSGMDQKDRSPQQFDDLAGSRDKPRSRDYSHENDIHNQPQKHSPITIHQKVHTHHGQHTVSPNDNAYLNQTSQQQYPQYSSAIQRYHNDEQSKSVDEKNHDKGHTVENHRHSRSNAHEIIQSSAPPLSSNSVDPKLTRNDSTRVNVSSIHEADHRNDLHAQSHNTHDNSSDEMVNTHRRGLANSIGATASSSAWNKDNVTPHNNISDFATQQNYIQAEVVDSSDSDRDSEVSSDEESQQEEDNVSNNVVESNTNNLNPILIQNTSIDSKITSLLPELPHAVVPNSTTNATSSDLSVLNNHQQHDKKDQVRYEDLNTIDRLIRDRMKQQEAERVIASASSTSSVSSPAVYSEEPNRSISMQEVMPSSDATESLNTQNTHPLPPSPVPTVTVPVTVPTAESSRQQNVMFRQSTPTDEELSRVASRWQLNRADNNTSNAVSTTATSNNNVPISNADVSDYATQQQRPDASQSRQASSLPPPTSSSQFVYNIPTSSSDNIEMRFDEWQRNALQKEVEELRALLAQSRPVGATIAPRVLSSSTAYDAHKATDSNDGRMYSEISRQVPKYSIGRDTGGTQSKPSDNGSSSSARQQQRVVNYSDYLNENLARDNTVNSIKLESSRYGKENAERVKQYHEKHGYYAPNIIVNNPESRSGHNKRGVVNMSGMLLGLE